jgi:ubiquinone/menaquinone biosynthesis C-methylase UbiE
MKNRYPTNWDEIALLYDQQFGDEGDFSHKYIIHPAVLSSLGQVKDKRIVDLGCGTGTLARQLARLGAKVTGVDISSEMLKYASKRNEKVEYLKHDIEQKLPYNDKEFDITISIMVFHSIENISNVITESYRILKNNATMIVVIPHPCFVQYFRSLECENDSLYLTPQKATFNWKQFTDICSNPTEFYLRPISFYINLFLSAGFILNSVKEPLIDESAQCEVDEIHTKNAYNRLREKPSFLLIKFTKS